MTFDAIYEVTSGPDNTDSYRQFEAAGLQEAKAVLRDMLTAEGSTYVLHALTETAASFAARRQVAA